MTNTPKQKRSTLAEEPREVGARGTFAVGLYIRVSTDRQAKEGDSLEEQESELKKFCDFRGFQIHQIYIERGKSGGNTNRPEYQKLVKDIEAKKINAIIVKKLDRLSRSLLDFEQLMTRLQANEVEFISLRESFDTTTAMGKAMLRVALVFAQLEREQTAERITDVMQYRASLGLHNGGHPPFGYVCVNKEWVIFQKEKEIVELIFGRFRELKSTLLVATTLNDMGLKARRGKLWDCRQILKMLQSPTYLGHRKWKDQVFKNTHPPIIAEKYFQEVGAILKKRLNKFTNLNAPLQKLLTCGDCGSIMTPCYSLNHARIKFYYYRCSQRSGQSGAKFKKTCSIKQVSFKSITNRVVEAISQFTASKHLNAIEAKVIQHNREIDVDQSLVQAQIKTLEVKETSLKEHQNKFLDSLILGNFSAKERQRINTKLEELDLELKQVATQLQHHEFALTQKEAEKLSLAHIKHALMELQDLDSGDIAQFRTGLIEAIQKIIVYKTRLTFSFRFLPWEIDFDG
jgi:site-specific DNA recombinase